MDPSDEPKTDIEEQLAALFHYMNRAFKARDEYPEIISIAARCVEYSSIQDLSGAMGEDLESLGGDPDLESNRKRKSSAPIPRAGIKKLGSFLETHQSVQFGGRLRTLVHATALFQEILRLNDLERDFLLMLYCCKKSRHFENWADEIFKAYPEPAEAAGCVLGISRDEAATIVGPKSKLIMSGLLELNGNSRDFTDCFEPMRHAWKAANHWHNDASELREALLGPLKRTKLEPAAFEHVGEDRDFLAKVLEGSAASEAEGVNLLLYGPPGTGKTELAGVLCSMAGLTLYRIGEADEDGDEPTRGERLAMLRTAQHLVSPAAGVAFLVDECEDLFGSGEGLLGDRPPHSKVFVNRTLESNRIPTIWIANEVRRVPVTVRRRMTSALHLDIPSPDVRQRIWHEVAQNNGVALSREMASELAHTAHVAPGVAEKAIQASALADHEHGGASRATKGLVRALAGDRALRRDRMDAETELDPRLLCADTDLDWLTGRLQQAGRLSFSLCLHGPPGTGKSAYIRHLANRLGLEVAEKRVSDLVSPLVGETEQNIARAFERARDRGLFLVFDEADSLLSDRRGAHRTFEVTQVNELLSWMETHPYPFACTTNLMENVDAAALRRFTFKIAFEHLDRNALATAFEAFFGMQAPTSVLELENLTPGDFVVVARKAAFLGEDTDTSRLAEMLHQESEAKGEARKPIGFVHPET